MRANMKKCAHVKNKVQAMDSVLRQRPFFLFFSFFLRRLLRGGCVLFSKLLLSAVSLINTYLKAVLYFSEQVVIALAFSSIENWCPLALKLDKRYKNNLINKVELKFVWQMCESRWLFSKKMTFLLKKSENGLTEIAKQ